MWAAIVDGMVDGCILAVRGVIGAVVVIVLMQAIAVQVTDESKNRFLAGLKRISDRVAAPSRTMLPPGAQQGRWDMAPLVSALILMLIGFGFEAFLTALLAGE